MDGILVNRPILKMLKTWIRTRFRKWYESEKAENIAEGGKKEI